MRRILPAIAAGAAIIASLAVSGASAQPPSPAWSIIPPVADPAAIPLYPQATLGSANTETWFRFEGQVVCVRNVTRPTLTPVLPAPGKATGAAVIIAPGGAFEFLSIDHEGWKIAHALADRGVAAFILKYRLKPTPADQSEWQADLMGRLSTLSAANTAARANRGRPEARPRLQLPEATADALAAVSLVRSNAVRWGVDPNRVGMIGFSAGAAAALSEVLAAKPGQSPNFFGLIYGPMSRTEVPIDAPPMFAAIAADDPFFSDTSIVSAWHEAQRPAELHIYQAGGHGFGLGKPGTTNALWMDEFMAWLSMQGFLAGTAGR